MSEEEILDAVWTVYVWAVRVLQDNDITQHESFHRFALAYRPWITDPQRVHLHGMFDRVLREARGDVAVAGTAKIRKIREAKRGRDGR